MKVTVTHEITDQRAWDVLENGFAWNLDWLGARWTRHNGVELENMFIGVWQEGEWEEQREEGTLKLVHDPDNGIYELTDALIAKGLQILADDYPSLMTELVEENDDANTGDVLLQCCLFGGEVYS